MLAKEWQEKKGAALIELNIFKYLLNWGETMYTCVHCMCYVYVYNVYMHTFHFHFIMAAVTDLV